ncbi:hypothetical protein EJB05_52229, partial [Eragrostis curvula]
MGGGAPDRVECARGHLGRAAPLLVLCDEDGTSLSPGRRDEDGAPWEQSPCLSARCCRRRWDLVEETAAASEAAFGFSDGVKDGVNEKDWLALVAVHSDSWLMTKNLANCFARALNLANFYVHIQANEVVLNLCQNSLLDISMDLKEGFVLLWILESVKINGLGFAQIMFAFRVVNSWLCAPLQNVDCHLKLCLYFLM